MKIIFHHDFHQVYTSDPAAAQGRMESIFNVVSGGYEFLEPTPANEEDIAAIHTLSHIDYVKRIGLYDISSLAAGGAIQAAFIGLKEPCFAMIRPPGHHASTDRSWGFCYFNNMAIALERLKREKAINKAFVLDIDLHFGDGTVNIFRQKDYVTIFNVSSNNRESYLREIAKELGEQQSEIIGISAGFDNHKDDWETPKVLYDELNKEFIFDFDPCPLNATFDGLKSEWKNRNFINPPYSRKLKEGFIKKALEESRKGKLCVMLLPVSTSTKIFHEVIYPNAEIRFLKGRVKFEGINTFGKPVNNKCGMHDSMIVIFRGDHL